MVLLLRGLYSFILPSFLPTTLSLLSLVSILLPLPLLKHWKVLNITFYGLCCSKISILGFFFFLVHILNFYEWYFASFYLYNMLSTHSANCHSFFFFSFIFISWRLITLQYCSVPFFLNQPTLQKWFLNSCHHK